MLFLKAASVVVSIATLGVVNAITGRGIQGLFSERADTLQKLDVLLDKFGMNNIKEAVAVSASIEAKAVVQNIQDDGAVTGTAPPFTKDN